MEGNVTLHILNLQPKLREEFWENVSVPGEPTLINKNLEYAGRVADYLEFAELLTRDALDGIRNMPAHGGDASLSNVDIRRATIYIVNQSGGKWKEPASAKDMAENMYRALWSWVICVIVTVAVVLSPRPSFARASPSRPMNPMVERESSRTRSLYLFKTWNVTTMLPSALMAVVRTLPTVTPARWTSEAEDHRPCPPLP